MNLQAVVRARDWGQSRHLHWDVAMSVSTLSENYHNWYGWRCSVASWKGARQVVLVGITFSDVKILLFMILGSEACRGPFSIGSFSSFTPTSFRIFSQVLCDRLNRLSFFLTPLLKQLARSPMHAEKGSDTFLLRVASGFLKPVFFSFWDRSLCLFCCCNFCIADCKKLCIVGYFEMLRRMNSWTLR